MYDLAKERNTKGVTTYKHAYDSMKACPLTFSHPSEAQQLGGIGPKICDRLTEKLKEHCEANGLPAPKKPRGKARKRLSAEDLADVEEPAPAKKPRKAKAYVPSLRSGPYAVILALSSMPEDSLQSLSKAQLIELAQPHCDSSFSVPSEPGKFYTAWNSMKTLLDKDLVHERGRPLRKYALTDEGWQVARNIRAAQEGAPEGHMGKKARKETVEEPEEDANLGVFSKAVRVTKGVASFMDIEDDYEDHTGDLFPQQIHKSASTLIENRPGSASAGQRLGGNPVDKYGTFSKQKILEVKKPVAAPRNNFIELSSSPEPPAAPDIPWASSTFTQDSRNLGSKPAIESKPTEPSKSLKPNLAPPKKPIENNIAEPVSLTTSDVPTFDPIIIKPGTFTVHLVLDNREIRSTDDRDYISKELKKRGVSPLVRPLELGDFFWVAKLHSNTFLTQRGEEGDEIALDWIVERKRLDDLVGSITDGRFQEQKFRLRKSGVKNVIYLIEEISLSTEKATKFHDAIQSALASTQVVNGYFVKQTKKLDDTIRYLARMTHMLKSLYESRPLHLISTSVLTPTTYLPLLKHLRTHPFHSDKSYHITYPSFASLSSKSDTLTLRDVFLKMLMCTKGISGDKALAIQKQWSTPRAFIEAFEACEGQKQREALVESKLGNLVGRGKVKGVLGAKVAGVWGEE